MLILNLLKTLVVQVAIALDPPIRKGQTYYHHVLVQFSKDEELAVSLDISDELFAAKNEKVPPAPRGCAHDSGCALMLQCAWWTASI